MRKLVLVVMAFAFAAMPAFAQGAAATTNAGNTGVGSWALAAIGLGIAVACAAIGQGMVASSACEGLARNPAARPGIQLALILGLAFVESLVLFIWVMIFLKVPAV
ncbi:MAG: ATP synthase F0 subunit C [Terriglobia bacterium]|jgi:F-type H+-transporting ATPase subunit c|nr:ATP synthase F0 subunit C [Terriglobia bacterium]